MRFTLIVPASLASVMASPLAAPSPDIDESFLDHLTDGEAHVIKRSATISARDVELAQRDGVDLGQMYRHSVVKRDDWVDNSYVDNIDEEDADSGTDGSDDKLVKRQKVKIPGRYFGNGSSKNCMRHAYIGDTGPNAPYTEGAATITKWASS